MKVLCECGLMCDISPEHVGGLWKPSKTMEGRIVCTHKKKEQVEKK